MPLLLLAFAALAVTPPALWALHLPLGAGLATGACIALATMAVARRWAA